MLSDADALRQRQTEDLVLSKLNPNFQLEYGC
jgi:hypothetical protein